MEIDILDGFVLFEGARGRLTADEFRADPQLRERDPEDDARVEQGHTDAHGGFQL